MNNNLFLSLVKYSFSDKKSPKENFLTESLSYFLRNSLYNGCAFLNDFLKLLNCDDNYRVRSIETQKQYFVENKVVYVDLVIETDQGESLLIEVKYEAELNDYAIIDGKGDVNEINQIALYGKINKNLFLLSVSDYKPYENCTNIYWYEVYELFKKHGKFDTLTRQFVELMEHLNMRFQNTSKNLNQSSSDIFALLAMLKEAIRKAGMWKDRGRLSGDVNYLGYYVNSKHEIIRNKCVGNYAWVGIYQKEDNLVMGFEVWDDFINKSITKKVRVNEEMSFLRKVNLTKIEWSRYKNLLLEPFVFDDVFNDAEPMAKIELIVNWLSNQDDKVGVIYNSIC